MLEGYLSPIIVLPALHTSTIDDGENTFRSISDESFQALAFIRGICSGDFVRMSM